MTRRLISRRDALLGPLVMGCSLAASPVLTPVSFAAAPGNARLVVIILRGAMDGLDVVQPYGDRDFLRARRTLLSGEAAGATDLDGFFALHPGLSALDPLWRAGELGFVHATSTPYRDKRSHFDGQDLLEAGTPGFDAVAESSASPRLVARGGWLNRLLQHMPGATAQTGFAVGRDRMLVMGGAAPVSVWSPEAQLTMSDASARLFEVLYHDETDLRLAFEEARRLTISDRNVDRGGAQEGHADVQMALAQMQERMDTARRGGGHREIARFTAARLLEETRIAAFSLGGWDTHNNQMQSLRRPLAELSDVILDLKRGLGDVWGNTTVLALTEFGRTLQENGTKGTDHGTGGAMVFAGGAVRGGQVLGNWPGLSERDLYQERDLVATTDVRAWAASAMRGAYGLERNLLEEVVFPGLDMGAVPELLR